MQSCTVITVRTDQTALCQCCNVTKYIYSGTTLKYKLEFLTSYHSISILYHFIEDNVKVFTALHLAHSFLIIQQININIIILFYGFILFIRFITFLVYDHELMSTCDPLSLA